MSVTKWENLGRMLHHGAIPECLCNPTNSVNMAGSWALYSGQPLRQLEPELAAVRRNAYNA